MEKTGVKIVAKNSKAFHEYFVEERFEAGIELFGTEVKSIRLGTLNLKDAWCSVKDGELWVRQMHISPYESARVACSCTSVRSSGWPPRSSSTATPSFRSPFI